jgi:hypothetical protein
MDLLTMPKVLILHLNRFQEDASAIASSQKGAEAESCNGGSTFKKNSKPVQYPMTLNIGE